MKDSDVLKIASDCLGQKVTAVSKIGRGANSKVYHVLCAPQEYVVKFYFQHPSDARDRLGAEYKSFSFLREQGIHAVPKPVAISRENNCAFYEFIKGMPPGGDIGPKDIDGALDFVEKLKHLSGKAQCLDFAAASEAFFCGEAIVNGLKNRLKRFTFEEKSAEYQALKEYLHHEFLPLFEAVGSWSKTYLTGKGIGWRQELLEEFRTLSPSDFGFHNALRTPEGPMVFLDFEYFGWDDPVKMVSDFLWHPAMCLSGKLKIYFFSRMSAIFSDDPNFKVRLKGLYPLFGLKWCLIFLNEFIVPDFQRRSFAGNLVKNQTAIRLEQLAKAKKTSDKIKTMYKTYGS